MTCTELLEFHTAEWLACQDGCEGVEVHRDPDATWIVQRRSAWGNAAIGLRFNAADVERRLDAMVARYRANARGAAFWVSPLATPGDLEERLRRRGFRCRKRFPGMYCALGELPPAEPPAGLQLGTVEECPYLGRVTTRLRQFELGRMAWVASRAPRQAWDFAAWFDGEPVGACTLFLGSRVAGLFDVGVIKRVRNRGVGTALVAHAAAFARDRGFEGCVLIASGMGESVYRKLGFQEVCRLGYWHLKQGVGC